MYIEDKINFIALGGYGSGISAIPASLFDEVIKVEPSFICEKFEKPLEFKCDLKPRLEEKFITRGSVMLSDTFHLPVSRIPVPIRGIKF